jgi:hypothetical protein
MSDFSSDVVLTRVVPFLNPGAQEYVNTLRRVGRWQSVTLPAGVSSEAARYLRRLLAGEIADADTLVGLGLVSRTGRRAQGELQTAISGGVSQAETLETERRPYYNPATSQVEMLTTNEAREAGLLGEAGQPMGAGGPPLATGAGDVEPGEMAQPSRPTDPLGRPTEGPGFGRDLTPPTDETTTEPTTGPTGPTGPVTGPTGGVTGGAVVTEEPAAEPVDTGVPKDWETAAAEMYPEYYAIVKNVPEIADLLRRSLGPPAWSEQKFQAELRATNWWKTTTASARQWDAASALDPATYQARVDEAATAINQEALGYGIRLSEETAQQLALDSLRLGWGTQTITNAIGMRATEGGTAGATQLREGYYGQEVRRIARSYGVTLADETFNSFVNRIAVGDENFSSFQDYALSVAKSLYPTLTAQFDAGRTFDDAVAPYKEIAASTLELNPNDIDFMDPKWVTPITYMPDPQTGEQRLMNLAEWGRELRTNRAYGYEFTEKARQDAYSVVERLGRLFGRV